LDLDSLRFTTFSKPNLLIKYDVFFQNPSSSSIRFAVLSLQDPPAAAEAFAQALLDLDRKRIVRSSLEMERALILHTITPLPLAQR